MINIVLRGGVGNQLFQFSFGYAMAKKFNTGLIFDLTNYRTDRMREYSLDLFGGIRGRYDKVVGSLVDIREDGMPYNQAIVDQIKYDSCVLGYWQTEKYFAQYAKDLFKIFTPFQPITSMARDTLREIQNCGNRSVFLTIRRTDYVGNTFHGELPQSYYDQALKYIATEAGIDPHVFVFSDDPKWCEDNFRVPYETTIAGNFDRTTRDHLGREDEELFLMRNCAHSVCANSSYSWWGSWLADHNPYLIHKRIAVAPKQWFGPASNEDPKDIVPDRWVKI